MRDASFEEDVEEEEEAECLGENAEEPQTAPEQKQQGCEAGRLHVSADAPLSASPDGIGLARRRGRRVSEASPMREGRALRVLTRIL